MIMNLLLPPKVKNKAKIRKCYWYPDKKTKNNFTLMSKSKVAVYRKKMKMKVSCKFIKI